MTIKAKIPCQIKSPEGKLLYLLSAMENKKKKLLRISRDAEKVRNEITGVAKQISELEEKVRDVT